MPSRYEIKMNKTPKIQISSNVDFMIVNSNQQKFGELKDEITDYNQNFVKMARAQTATLKWRAVSSKPAAIAITATLPMNESASSKRFFSPGFQK